MSLEIKTNCSKGREALGDAGRAGTPWDVARAIVFLLSDDAAYVTGTELIVDGGMSACDDAGV